MSHIAVSGLAYAHPGGELLFSDVSFRLSPGRHAGLIGANGVGKSTLLRILAGELSADEGDAATGGRVGYMPQDVGTERARSEALPGGDRTVRALLLSLAPSAVRQAGEAMIELEAALEAGSDDAGMRLGHGDRATTRRSAAMSWRDSGTRPAADRRRPVLRAGRPPGPDAVRRRAQAAGAGAAVRSDADVLLLDEPDNFLDVPAKLALERRVRAVAQDDPDDLARPRGAGGGSRLDRDA